MTRILPKTYCFFAALLFFSMAGAPSLARNFPANQPSSGDIQSVAQSSSSPPEKQGRNYVEGQVIVSFKEGTSTDAIETIKRDLHLDTIRTFSSPNLFLMRICDSTPVETVLDRLKSFSAVKYAEPNFVMKID